MVNLVGKTQTPDETGDFPASNPWRFWSRKISKIQIFPFSFPSWCWCIGRAMATRPRSPWPARRALSNELSLAHSSPNFGPWRPDQTREEVTLAMRGRKGNAFKNHLHQSLKCYFYICHPLTVPKISPLFYFCLRSLCLSTWQKNHFGNWTLVSSLSGGGDFRHSSKDR